MSFRLVPKSVTLNDLERRNGVILRCFSEFGQFPGALRKSSRSLSHLLMSSCIILRSFVSLASFLRYSEMLVKHRVFYTPYAFASSHAGPMGISPKIDSCVRDSAIVLSVMGWNAIFPTSCLFIFHHLCSPYRGFGPSQQSELTDTTARHQTYA